MRPVWFSRFSTKRNSTRSRNFDGQSVHAIVEIRSAESDRCVSTRERKRFFFLENVNHEFRNRLTLFIPGRFGRPIYIYRPANIVALIETTGTVVRLVDFGGSKRIKPTDIVDSPKHIIETIYRPCKSGGSYFYRAYS